MEDDSILILTVNFMNTDSITSRYGGKIPVRLSLKIPPSLKFLLDCQKYWCSFFFALEGSLKQNHLHLVRYAAVFLLWFS